MNDFRCLSHTNSRPISEPKRERKGFGHLSILLLGKDALGRALSRVSQPVSWSLIPKGPSLSCPNKNLIPQTGIVCWQETPCLPQRSDDLAILSRHSHSNVQNKTSISPRPIGTSPPERRRTGVPASRTACSPHLQGGRGCRT